MVAGILLAWSICKPQSTWLYMPFILVFCVRYRLVLLPNNSSADQLFLLMPLLLWILWKSANEVPARAAWISLFLVSYLTFFADLMTLRPRPIMTWTLLVFASWAGWLLVRQNRQKRV